MRTTSFGFVNQLNSNMLPRPTFLEFELIGKDFAF